MEVRRGGDEKLLPQPCNTRYSDAKKMYTSEARHRWCSVERDGAVWNVCSKVAQTELCVSWTSQ